MDISILGVTGANDISLCHRYCPDGEELVDDICEQCPIGYYKNNDDGRFENCTVCPDPAFITEGIDLNLEVSFNYQIPVNIYSNCFILIKNSFK